MHVSNYMYYVLSVRAINRSYDKKKWLPKGTDLSLNSTTVIQK